MQWNKNTCSHLKTVLRQVQSGEQTQQVRLPDEMPDVGRVLCTWGQCIVRSKQWRQDSLIVTGGVSASVLYLPEEKNEPQSVDVWLPFQLKWSVPQTQREGNVRISCLIKSMDTRILSARKLMVRSAVGILAEAMQTVEADVYSPIDMSPDMQILTKTYPVVLAKEAGEKEFGLESEIHIPNVKKCFCWNLEPIITEETLLGSRVILRGVGQLQYVYMDEDNQIHTGSEDIPFAQFIDLDGEYAKETSADVILAVSGLEPEITDDGVTVRCNLIAQYVVMEQTLLRIGEDAYSTQYDVTISEEILDLPVELEQINRSIDAHISLPEGKILNLCFWPEHPNAFREGTEVNIDFSGLFQILYEDAEQQLQAVVEPWSDSMALSVAENAQIHAMLNGFDQQSTGGKLEIGIQTDARQLIPMITALTVGQPLTKEPDRPTMIIKRMEEDSLWYLAKKNGSTVEAIQRANGLCEEPDGGQMLLIPVL